MRLVKIGSRYLNPDQLVAVVTNDPIDGQQTSKVYMTGGGEYSLSYVVWGDIDKVAMLFTDDISGEVHR